MGVSNEAGRAILGLDRRNIRSPLELEGPAHLRLGLVPQCLLTGGQ